jgi:hypothetical protein
VNESSIPGFYAPRARATRPATVLARAVAWGVVRTLAGLLAAGILLSYAATIA